jgi:carbamate kinase
MASRRRTAVIALGGNALSPAGERSTIFDQFRHTRDSLMPIVALVQAGWRVCIVHGNGPQVGDELVRNEEARATVEPLPLGVLVAATAGWIGYMIQQSLENALRAAGSDSRVATVLTQVVVRRDDPALSHPAKFVGHELSSGALEGLYCVIDKYLAAAVLAAAVGADLFMILTDVDAVYADWGKPTQRPLPRVTVDEIEHLDRQAAFGEGSMAPKVRAAAKYVRQTGGRAIITELSRGSAAVAGHAGTEIVPH